MNINTSEDQVGQKKGPRDRILFLIALLLVVAIMAGVFYLLREYPERIDQLQGYGYLGAFLISLILNATIVLPVGNVLVMATLGATLPSAIAVGIVGGAGAAIGELTGYMAGYSGQAIIRRQKMYARLEGWVRKWGGMTILLISIVPFVFDLAGIAAGMLRFPVWKFLLYCWTGRAIFYSAIALAGAWGWEALLRYLG